MASPSVIAPSGRATRPGKLAIPPVSAASSPGSALQISPGSGASTPTSSTPQLAMKPAANGPVTIATMASTPGPQCQPAKNSITSKEWVIPPRPKPGRKPATDTPPTKRKAQNRAAQRAFRERRAARVGELEELLDEQRQEHERVERDLHEHIQGMDTEVHNLRDRCSALEGLLDKERAERGRVANELEAMRRRLRDEQASASARNNSLPGLHAALSQHHTPRSSIASTHSGHRNSAFAISQLISPSNPSDSSSDRRPHDAGCGGCDPNGPCVCVDEVLSTASHVVDCGNCSLGTRCECLEAALNPSTNTEPDLKRRPSSISPLEPEEKRHKPSHSENEIDFTAMFSKKGASAVATIPEPLPPPIAIPPRDSCGFCTEGTYCMCAEAAAAAAAESQSLAPMGSQVQTPPPSDGDVGPPPMEFTSTGAVKLPRLSSLNRPAPSRSSNKSGGCGPNGPGTCAQCLADPKSGLFCRSLAANFEKQGGTSKAGGGCCGGSAGGGCCKSKPSVTSGPSVGLSCADAYKTISSHRNFERAADDISSWLPKLRAVPRPQEVGESSSRRPPIEVETASIMSVLKGFDVRFGREA
ncbi:hypothetical protein JX265_005594 [Neoarthrinium moseri]|uniref:BZIP domain-containing protein n=1 Tax=Neoarthrinium moseri TaxID=1658444 RepID=A0A9P9WN41_9PEZI|nr:hypothetical protein JX265_005594 [Neoarthrinium moseri]